MGNPWSHLGKVSVPTLFTAQVKKLLAIAAFRAFKTLLLQQNPRRVVLNKRRTKIICKIASPQFPKLIHWSAQLWRTEWIQSPLHSVQRRPGWKCRPMNRFCKEKRKIARTMIYLRTFPTLPSVHRPVLRVLPAIADVHSNIPKDCVEHAVACIALQYVYLLVYLFSSIFFFRSWFVLFFSVYFFVYRLVCSVLFVKSCWIRGGLSCSASFFSTFLLQNISSSFVVDIPPNSSLTPGSCHV